jgi:hypothetical protein
MRQGVVVGPDQYPELSIAFVNVRIARNPTAIRKQSGRGVSEFGWFSDDPVAGYNSERTAVSILAERN